MVAAAALLAEAPEQRGDVFSQHAAAVLDEEADQLTHLQGDTQHLVITPEREPSDFSVQLLTIRCSSSSEKQPKSCSDCVDAVNSLHTLTVIRWRN